jgi:hypothetical protein
MSVTMVSRWKGNEDYAPLLKEEAPFLKKHGAISVRNGRCFAGSYAGEIVCATTFADWSTYARAMEGLVADPAFMRVYGEFARKFEMTDRSLVVDEEY